MANPDYIDNTYNALKAKVDGFNKTPEQYRQLVLNDPQYRANVHKALTDKVEGFKRTTDEFDELLGLKKKEPSAPGSDNPNIPVVTISGTGSESRSLDGTLSLPNRSVNTEFSLTSQAPPTPVNAPKDTQVQPGSAPDKEVAKPLFPLSPEEYHSPLTYSNRYGNTVSYDPKNVLRNITEAEKKGAAYRTLQKAMEPSGNQKHLLNVADQILNTISDDNDGYKHELKAYIQNVNGDPNSAKESLKLAISLSPNNTRLYPELATTSAKAGDTETAIQSADKYIHETGGVSDGDETRADNLAAMYRLKGNEQKADFFTKNADFIREDKAKNNLAESLKTMPEYLMSTPLNPASVLFSGIGQVGAGVESIHKAITDATMSKTDRMLTALGGGFEIMMGGGSYIFPGEGWAGGLGKKAFDMAAAGQKVSALRQAGTMAAGFVAPELAEFNLMLNAFENVAPQRLVEVVTAPISTALNISGADMDNLTPAQRGAINIGNMLGMMLWSKAAHAATQGIKAEANHWLKAYDNFKNQEPITPETQATVAEAVSTATTNEINGIVQSLKMAADKKQVIADLRQYQNETPQPTYRVGDQLVSSPQDVVDAYKKMKAQGIEPDVQVANDPEGARFVSEQLYKHDLDAETLAKLQSLKQKESEVAEQTESLKQPEPEAEPAPVQTESQDFDYTDIFTQPDNNVPVDISEKPNKDVLEEQYQKSNFDKKWAATRDEAIAKTIDEFNKAKSEKDKWSSKTYKSAGKASVQVGDELSGGEFSINSINEGRKRKAIKAADQTMQDALNDMKKLGMTKDEINAVISPPANPTPVVPEVEKPIAPPAGEEVAGVQTPNTTTNGKETQEGQGLLKPSAEKKTVADGNTETATVTQTNEAGEGKEKQTPETDDLRIIDKELYHKIKGSQTAPNGMAWFSNAESIFSKNNKRKSILLPEKLNTKTQTDQQPAGGEPKEPPAVSPTTVEDFNKLLDNLDKSVQHTDLSKLEVGDFVYVPSRKGRNGEIKQSNAGIVIGIDNEKSKSVKVAFADKSLEGVKDTEKIIEQVVPKNKIIQFIKQKKSNSESSGELTPAPNEKNTEIPLYEIRKSKGGYSVDKKEFGNWTFVQKFNTKKEAQNFIDSRKQSTPTDTTPTQKEAGTDNKPATDLLNPTRTAGDTNVGEFVRFTPPDNAGGYMNREKWYGKNQLREYNDGSVTGRVIKKNSKSVTIKVENPGAYNDGEVYRVPNESKATIDLSKHIQPEPEQANPVTAKEVKPTTIDDLDSVSKHFLKTANDKLNFSQETTNKVLQVARKIADIDNSDKIKVEHVAEAINYFSGEWTLPEDLLLSAAKGRKNLSANIERMMKIGIATDEQIKIKEQLETIAQNISEVSGENAESKKSLLKVAVERVLLNDNVRPENVVPDVVKLSEIAKNKDLPELAEAISKISTEYELKYYNSDIRKSLHDKGIEFTDNQLEKATADYLKEHNRRSDAIAEFTKNAQKELDKELKANKLKPDSKDASVKKQIASIREKITKKHQAEYNRLYNERKELVNNENDFIADNISKQITNPAPTATSKPKEPAKGNSNEINSAVSKYGWKAEPTDTGYDLYNSKGKKVVTVTVKGDKYTMTDQAGNKLLSGNKDISQAAQGLIRDYYYGKEVKQPEPTTATDKPEPASDISAIAKRIVEGDNKAMDEMIALPKTEQDAALKEVEKLQAESRAKKDAAKKKDWTDFVGAELRKTIPQRFQQMTYAELDEVLKQQEKAINQYDNNNTRKQEARATAEQIRIILDARSKAEQHNTKRSDLSTATSIQDLQSRFSDKAGTPEYNKKMEELRGKGIKERSDELAARIKKQGYDAIDEMTMMAILPYQKQIMKAAVWTTAEAIKITGKIADAVAKGVEKIRELAKEQNLSTQETDKLIKKFEGMPQWKDVDSPNVQREIEETVGIRNKLKNEYRLLKDKLFQAEKRLKNATKTEAYEKGASSRNKEIGKLSMQSARFRAELETIDDVKSTIKQSIIDNKDVIRKLTGQKTQTLLNRVNNATTYSRLKKALDYIEKVTTDIEFKEKADDISRMQKDIKFLIKQNEFIKGANKGYRSWATEIASIPKDKLADLPSEMLDRLQEVASQIIRRKVSDVKNLEKFFDDFRNEMDNVFDDASVEKVVSAESMMGLINNIDKISKIIPSDISNYDDIVNLKRNLSLVKNKIDKLMAQEDIQFADGKFFDRDGNEITELSDLSKYYEDSVKAESVKELFSMLNKKGVENITEELLAEIEANAKKQWKKQAKDNWSLVDWDNLSPEQVEVLKWMKSNARDNVIDELSLGELDTYAKVLEQLTYGNMPRKTIDIASSMDVTKKSEIIGSDFVNVLRATAEKSNYIKKHLLSEDAKGDLQKSIAWKTDLTDIDEKYGLANKHQHPIFDIFNEALLKAVEFTNVDRDKLFHTALKFSPFTETLKPDLRSRKAKELSDREVNALRVMMCWQANIPEAKVEKIMAQTGLTKEQVLSYWEISESDWGKRYIADAKKSKGYDSETIKIDRHAYENLKKRNGGKPIIFDLSKSDEQILYDAKKLLSSSQHNFLVGLDKGYKDQLHKMKVNAVKQNIALTELRLYDPFFIFDKPVDDFGNASDFISNIMIDRSAPHTKSGNVNERTFDYHISRMNATDKFRQYTLTNLLNYHMADPLYNSYRALRRLVNKPVDSGRSLSTPEVQVLSELAEGLKSRFTNVYATNLNRGMGMKMVNKFASTGAKIGRVALLDPTRLIKDTAGNQFTALGQLPISQWGDYLDMAFKLDKSETDMLQLLHDETGFREAERYYSEYSDSNPLTKKGLFILSYNDRATQKRIFLNEFEHAFSEFSGKEFDMEAWKSDEAYREANRDVFEKASAEAKWMAYDTFPSMEKIVRKAQKDPSGFGDIMVNFMQTWQIRESLRFGKQVKNLMFNTNEGRAEAAKKIGSFFASQSVFSTLGVLQAAGLSLAAGALVSSWDKETGDKLKSNAKKTVSQLKSPLFWTAQGINGLTSLSLGRFGNWNRIGQVTTLSALNAPYVYNKKPDWLKNVNEYAQAAFYVKPIELNKKSWLSAEKQVDAVLQMTMAMEPIFRTVLNSGQSMFDISKKVIEGKSLTKSEQDAWNIARAFHLVMVSKYGYPGAGTVDKFLTRVSNAEKSSKKESVPGKVSIGRKP